MSPAVPVVVVHHDQPERCVATVAAFCDQEGVAEVAVVDSGSTPAARAALAGLPAGVEVIDAGANVGFGGGANLGLRRFLSSGRGEWAAVAPHDALPAKGCVAALVAAAGSHPEAGLVCAELGEGLELVPVADKVIGGYYRRATRRAGWEEVDYPHGTLMLARRAMLDDVGLFDERYFAYCEEVDLALRARAAGWTTGLVWGAAVKNGRLPEPGLACYLQLRNTLLLVAEHSGPRELRARRILAWTNRVARAWREPSQARSRGRIERRAVEDFLLGSFGAPPPEVLRASGTG